MEYQTGWIGKDQPEVLREAFTFFGNDFQTLNIRGSRPIEGARSMLWEVGRKVLGEDTTNVPQLIGDCVSRGAMNAVEYLQFFPLANGERKAFKRIYSPYLYGCGRVFVGNRQLKKNQDGSLGIWQAKAVMEYGVIPTDTPSCPDYSAEIARDWGYNGPPQKFINVGKTYIVKSAALVKTWDELCQALINGYPVTVASNVGFDMKARSDGFFYNSTEWNHQMCIIGVDNEYKDPYGALLNSWGDSHGEILDFKTGERWPKGTIRAKRNIIEKILAQGDSFAYSAFDGFPAQELPREFFDFI